jgi:hypothetical protein
MLSLAIDKKGLNVINRQIETQVNSIRVPIASYYKKKVSHIHNKTRMCILIYHITLQMKGRYRFMYIP